MASKIYHGFLDESPSLVHEEKFFLVALLVSEYSQLKALRRIPRQVRERRSLGDGRRDVPELKFSRSEPAVREYLLSRLSKQDVQIVIYAVDTERRLVNDSPENYGIVLGNAISLYLSRVHPFLNLTTDRKYTSPTDRAKLDDTVTRVIAQKAPSGVLKLLDHVESYSRGVIQLADFVAGAAHQKYNFGEPRYLDWVAEKIVLEKEEKWRKIKAEFVANKKWQANPGGR